MQCGCGHRTRRPDFSYREDSLQPSLHTVHQSQHRGYLPWARKVGSVVVIVHAEHDTGRTNLTTTSVVASGDSGHKTRTLGNWRG